MDNFNFKTCILAGIIVLIGLASCSHDYDARLLSSERLMEACPDSALAILSKIGPEELSRDADIAKFRLLKTQALVKLDSVATDETQISASRDYFAKYGNSPDYMKSLFYTGWIQYGNGEYYNSMMNVTEAYDIATGMRDSYWTAKCAELMSFIFQANYSYAEANRYSMKAAEEYERCRKDLNSTWCRIDVANSYSGRQMNDSALFILSKMPEPKTSLDSMAWSAALYTKLITLYNSGNYSAADSVFDVLMINNKRNIGPMPYYIKAMLLSKAGKIEEVPFYLQMGDAMSSDLQDSATMRRAHIMYAVACRDYEAAFHIADTLFFVNSTISDIAFKNEASLAQRDYFNNKAEQEHIRAERKRLISISICIIAAVIVVCSVVYGKMRLRVKNVEISDKANHILLISERLRNQTIENSRLVQTITEKNSQIDTLNDRIDRAVASGKTLTELKNKVMNVYLRDLRSLSSTCNELYNSVDEKIQKTLLKKIKSELDKMRSSKNMKAVEDLVNEYRENIMIKAREDLKELDKRNFMLLNLLYSGLDADVIGVLLDIKYNSFGPTKARLKTKIENCNSMNTRYYLDALN